VPEYFEGYCTTHRCKTYAVICCGRDNPNYSTTQKTGQCLFSESWLRYQFTTWPAQ